MKDEIFPDHRFLSRQIKEATLNQKGLVLWFTGLSGSGKSTLAEGLEKKLHEKGYFTAVLDGDNIRDGLCKNLGFSETDRMENIRRVAEAARLFKNNGILTMCCFISPTREIRKIARNIIGDQDFFEIYLSAPIEVCEERDVKGLYARARRGEIDSFTGIHQKYEKPHNPAMILDTTRPIEENSITLFDFVDNLQRRRNTD